MCVCVFNCLDKLFGIYKKKVFFEKNDDTSKEAGFYFDRMVIVPLVLEMTVDIKRSRKKTRREKKERERNTELCSMGKAVLPVHSKSRAMSVHTLLALHM